MSHTLLQRLKTIINLFARKETQKLVMTINHIFVWVSRPGMNRMRTFYRSVLEPLGYTEMIRAYNDTLIGYGSDYPYLWLKQAPEGKPFLPTHIAIDAPGKYFPCSCEIG